jgi:hypothetical protein
MIAALDSMLSQHKRAEFDALVVRLKSILYDESGNVEIHSNVKHFIDALADKKLTQPIFERVLEDAEENIHSRDAFVRNLMKQSAAQELLCRVMSEESVIKLKGYFDEYKSRELREHVRRLLFGKTRSSNTEFYDLLSHSTKNQEDIIKEELKSLLNQSEGISSFWNCYLRHGIILRMLFDLVSDELELQQKILNSLHTFNPEYCTRLLDYIFCMLLSKPPEADSFDRAVLKFLQLSSDQKMKEAIAHNAYGRRNKERFDPELNRLIKLYGENSGHKYDEGKSNTAWGQQAGRTDEEIKPVNKNVSHSPTSGSLSSRNKVTGGKKGRNSR